LSFGLTLGLPIRIHYFVMSRSAQTASSLLRALSFSFALLGFLLVAPLSWGSSVIWFVDGRAMEVETVEIKDGVATAVLAGGIEIMIPASRIEGVGERRPPKPPQPAPTAAGQPGAARQGNSPWRQRAGQYADLIANVADRHRVDPVLLTAMAQVESAWNSGAVSHKGAQGLLQLMPQTATRFGVRDSFDVSQNLDGGARYIRWLLDRYDGDQTLALAGYNAGEGAVDRHKGIPPYPETQAYVTKVLRHAGEMAQ
jgi:membrane-bound lytic murein transglycosylase B